MSLDSTSRTTSRSRSPIGRKIRTQRYSNGDAPYRQASWRVFSRCNKCGRPGHFARECLNEVVCHNCGLPGHIMSECNTKSLCWNCRQPGHFAENCQNETICYTCGKPGHRARDCTEPPGDVRMCNKRYKLGHGAASCTNYWAGKNRRKPGHRRGAGVRGRGFRDVVCRTCQQMGHMIRDCDSMTKCRKCGGRGHLAFECPSGTFRKRWYPQRR